MEDIKLKTMPVAELMPADYNPRTIDADALEGLGHSIDRFGLVEPIIWNKQTGRVVGGHQRLKVLLARGIEATQVIEVDLNESEERALNITLNNQEIQGEWDIDSLREMIEGLQRDLGDDAILNLRIAELAEEVGLYSGEKQGKTEPDQVPEVPEKPTTKQGDIITLGQHRLICGDSCEPDTLKQLMGKRRADMVFTDPPYNVNYGRKILNDNFKGDEGFQQFLQKALEAMKRYVLGDVYVCMSSSNLHLLHQAFTACGGHWSTFVIWVKDHFTIGRANYQRQYEPILYGWFDQTTHYWSGVRNLGDIYEDEIQVDTDGTPLVRVEACGIESDIWKFPKPRKNKDHPTQKPVDLCKRAIYNSSRKGAGVLDAFAGSGSTMIACEQIRRKCYMAELDPRYCDVIVRRWEEFTGKKAKRG